MRAYKFLRADGRGPFSRFAWPLPDGAPGAWVGAPADPCRSGIHACRAGDLPYWAGQVLYEVELVAARGRLLRPIAAWDDELRATYTRFCADRAHEIASGAGIEPWAGVVEPSIPEGPALLGFVAARIAEVAGGVDAYHAERARQAAWLSSRLGLT